MPIIQSVSADLNHHFSRKHIRETAANKAQFAPGKKLDLSMFLEKGSPLELAWKNYVGSLPPSFQEAVRSVIYHALSTTPPTLVTFAWAPGYDFELNIWQAPDTKQTKGGITVLMKSRYPSDAHPIAEKPARAAKAKS